jgi:hypothetical protein
MGAYTHLKFSFKPPQILMMHKGLEYKRIFPLTKSIKNLTLVSYIIKFLNYRETGKADD